MLTQKQIKALKARASRYFVAQDNLLLCVYPSGKKSFFYNFKCPKTRKHKRKKLGSFPLTSLKLAKKRKESLNFHIQRAFLKEQGDFEEELIEFRKNVLKIYQRALSLENLQGLQDLSRILNDECCLDCNQNYKLDFSTKETLNFDEAEFSAQRNVKKFLSFKELALKKMKGKKQEIKERTYLGLLSILRRFAFKFYGGKAVSEISAQDLLKSFIYLKNLKNKESANKLFTLLGEIFRYALMQGFIAQNPMQNLSRKDLILKKPTKHFATLTHKKDIKSLLNGVLNHSCEVQTKVAIFMLALTAQRSINVRTSLWSEIDFKKGLWSIPAEKMKMQKMHTVALNSQALALLERLKAQTFTPELFASSKSKYKIISENTMRRALKRLGYSGDEFVPHGFRAMFSTICHEHRREHKISSDIIEQCLAHSECNKVKASYNHASNLREKAQLMQWWGNYLDRIFNFKENLDRIFGENF